MRNITKQLIAFLFIGVIAPHGIAHAQHDAGLKARGDYHYYGNSAGSALRSANEQSNYYSQYVESVPVATPAATAQGGQEQVISSEVTREATDAIGNYITKARRHFAWMRAKAIASKDTETTAALDSIEKHMAAAAKAHHEMYEASLKSEVDSSIVKYSKQIDEELDKAISEHDKLMKRLVAAKSPVAKK